MQIEMKLYTFLSVQQSQQIATLNTNWGERRDCWTLPGWLISICLTISSFMVYLPRLWRMRWRFFTTRPSRSSKAPMPAPSLLPTFLPRYVSESVWGYCFQGCVTKNRSFPKRTYCRYEFGRIGRLLFLEITYFPKFVPTVGTFRNGLFYVTHPRWLVCFELFIFYLQSYDGWSIYKFDFFVKIFIQL